jgi:PE family
VLREVSDVVCDSTPETVAVAASDLARIGATIGAAGAAGAAAADPTTAVMPAAADEVSAAISSLFASCAQGYQAVSVQVEAFHNQLVQLMSRRGELRCRRDR